MTLLTLVAAARVPGKVPAYVEKQEMRSCIATSLHQYKSSSCTHFYNVCARGCSPPATHGLKSCAQT